LGKELLDAREAHMDTFAPEFSKFWLGDNAAAQGDTVADEDASQSAALQELAERVSAARSIV